MNTRRPYNFVLIGLLASGLLTTCGCGKAEYERRVMANADGMAAGGALGAPVPMEGTPLTIRLPLSIDANAKAYNEASDEPNGQGKVKPERLNPPFMKIPGLKICYEAQYLYQANNVKYPVFWYLGAMSAQDPLPDGKPIDQYAMDVLTAAFAAEKKTPTADTLEAGTQWKRVTISAMQSFILLDGNPRNEGGVFQMLVGEVSGWKIILAFRAPNVIIAQAKPEMILPLMAASVAPPAPQAPPAQ